MVSPDYSGGAGGRREAGIWPGSSGPRQVFGRICGVVRKGGLEPPWIAPPDPKSGASANSATFAWARLESILARRVHLHPIGRSAGRRPRGCGGLRLRGRPGGGQGLQHRGGRRPDCRHRRRAWIQCCDARTAPFLPASVTVIHPWVSCPDARVTVITQRNNLLDIPG